MTERKIILKHAGTVLAGQLAVVAFGVTDTLIAGRYDSHALAVLSVSSAIYITVYVALIGVIQALLPMFAELYGAEKFEKIGAIFRQTLYVWLSISVIGFLILISPYFILHWTQVPVELQADIQAYLGLLALALPPALFFRLYSSFNQSIGKPRLVTWLQIGGLIIKIPLSILLVFGFSFIPEMGLMGCALATVIVTFGMALIAIVLMKTSPLYARFVLWKKLEKPEWLQLKQMARLGLPNGFSVLVEVTSFTLMALFIARLGTAAAASHQIASNMTALLYMIPLSFSIAISARVSFWIGSGNFLKMREAVIIGFQLIGLEAVLMATILWLFSREIALLYTKDPVVSDIAAELLILIGFYHLGDALQTICFFVLRSFKITLVPMLLYSVMLWGVGLSGGYLLAYIGLPGIAAMQSPHAFWIMSILALAMVSISLVYMVWHNTKARVSQMDSV
ncbi:MAG: MATE family efflux transporter [Limnohabitans sp.]|nr:MATE family efflux transporter [Limnohabitans sp.]